MTDFIPAHCPNCDLTFDSRLIGLDPGASVRNFRVSNVTSQCPRCGATGRVTDGTYNLSRSVYQRIRTSTDEELGRVREELSRAREAHRLDEEELSEEARSWLAAILPDNKDQWYMLAGIIIAAITLWATLKAGQVSAGPESDVAIERISELVQQNTQINIDELNIVVPERGTTYGEDAATQLPRRVEKRGRNAQCFCGSGKKYKHCHLP